MNQPNSKLQRHVAKWIRETAKDSYDGDKQAVYDDLMHGGCQSGMVNHLIYYTETAKFYKRNAKEIDTMLAEMCADTGMSPAELFGDKWDSDDPLARDTYNQNLLAWFGFEETARVLMDA